MKKGLQLVSLRAKPLAQLSVAVTLIGVLASLGSQTAFAGRFANQFIEFELPAKWQCNLESAEWVCQNLDTAKKREAIIILAAKLRGPQDTLEQYTSYLKEPKSYTSVNGNPVRSEPKYSKSIDVNGQPWIDSLHLESEIPGFYTRYLVTIKEDIGVLVTVSINRLKYSDYVNDFESLVKTLKVFRRAGGINAAPKEKNLFADIPIPKGLSQNTVYPQSNEPVPSPTAGKAPAQADDDDLGFWLLILGAIVILVVLGRRRRGL